MTLSNTPQVQDTSPTSDETRDAPPHGTDAAHAVFVYDLDDITHEYNHPTITGAEVMAAGGIPASEGIVQIMADGTRQAVAADAVVHLVPGTQFKRRPRFKRG
jgi:hypothetical protein